jgi:hypothetical protein
VGSENPAAEILADYVARYRVPVHEPVEAGRLRDYLLALDEPPDFSPGRPVPPLFILTLGRTRRPQPARGSAVNAGEEYEFRAPVHLGDTITVARRIVDVEQKQGKVGRMYLARAESTYTNQHGELVAIARQNVLRWGW